MSFLVTRPETPLPLRREMSMPCSAAIRRTSGVERVRRRSSRVAGAPSPFGTASTTAAAAVTAFPGVFAAGSSFTAGAFSAAAAGASAFGSAATAAPASVSMRAITVPTSTVLPSSARISARVPASGDGMSASTLSVEISRIDSSRLTSSPIALSHFVIVPSAIDSPICGIMTSTFAIAQASLSTPASSGMPSLCPRSARGSSPPAAD